jgi:ankyrin repeat protein
MAAAAAAAASSSAAAKLNAQDAEGYTMLHHACWESAEAVTNALQLMSGSSSSSSSSSSGGGSAMLLDLNVQSLDGETALHLCCWRDSSYACLRALLQHAAATEAAAASTTTTATAVPPPLNVNARNRSGATALHYVARLGDAKRAGALLQHRDIDVNARNNVGETPLHTACYWKRGRVIAALLASGARCNVYTTSTRLRASPLHHVLLGRRTCYAGATQLVLAGADTSAVYAAPSTAPLQSYRVFIRNKANAAEIHAALVAAFEHRAAAVAASSCCCLPASVLTIVVGFMHNDAAL